MMTIAIYIGVQFFIFLQKRCTKELHFVTTTGMRLLVVKLNPLLIKVEITDLIV